MEKRVRERRGGKRERVEERRRSRERRERERSLNGFEPFLRAFAPSSRFSLLGSFLPCAWTEVARPHRPPLLSANKNSPSVRSSNGSERPSDASRMLPLGRLTIRKAQRPAGHCFFWVFFVCF